MLKSLVPLVVSVVIVGSLAMAGTARTGRPVRPPFHVSGEEVTPLNGHIPPRIAAPYALGPGDSIGFTTYDYGTNGSANHNLVNYGDGAIALGRMGAFQLGNGEADRGTKYSFSTDHGSTWLPLSSVEATRVGWSNIDQFSDPQAAGSEITVVHAGLEVNIDVQRGAGTWISASSGSTVGSTWPKLAVGDLLVAHIVAAAPNPPTGIYYTRTTDGGLSFNPVDQPVVTSATPDADGFDIAAQGSKVAMLLAGSGGDVVLQTSTNFGTNWTSQVLLTAPTTLPPGDSALVPDGSCSVIFDNNGNIRAAWGTYMDVGDAGGVPQTFYSLDAPICYWSQSTGIKQIAFPIQDSTFNNLSGAVGTDGDFATQPDIGVDGSNNLYVIFSQLISEVDVNNNNYQHIYGLRSTDGGTTWSTPVDLSPGTGFDAAFPSLANLVDADLHIVYLCDPLAGNFIQGNHSETQVAVMYLRAPVSSLTVGVPEGGGRVLPTEYSLKQNYPNPFNPSTVITYSLPAASDVRLTVYNTVGQEVATLVNEHQAAGIHEATFVSSRLSSGVYFYSLKAGWYTSSRKMVLMK